MAGSNAHGRLSPAELLCEHVSDMDRVTQRNYLCAVAASSCHQKQWTKLWITIRNLT